MKKVAIIFPNGYEELEALTVVDVLRRAEVMIDIFSANDTLDTVGAHGIQIKADYLLNELKPEDYSMLVTPGGLPGTLQLKADELVLHLVKIFVNEGKYVASICASPMILGEAEVTSDYKGTCYPGCEEQAGFGSASEDIVVVDRNIITSRGPATALPFALVLVEILAGVDIAEKVADEMLVPMFEKSVIDNYKITITSPKS